VDTSTLFAIAYQRFPEAQNSVCRMWDGGPLRQFSERQAGGHYVAYSSPILTGYAGSYVCDRCKRPCSGVYLAGPAKSWLCGPCKRNVQRLDSGGEPAKLVQLLEGDREQDGH
jgi:hypothetical protein